jgi:hypothetical protein
VTMLWQEKYKIFNCIQKQIVYVINFSYMVFEVAGLEYDVTALV